MARGAQRARHARAGPDHRGAHYEVGKGVTNLAPGDHVVIPFPIACGRCFMRPALREFPGVYEMFHKKRDGAIKVLLEP